jgi:hypothetical protein
MAAKPKQAPPVDYEAYFPVKLPADIVYMHNVLLTFVNAIPSDCEVHCLSEKHPVAPDLNDESARQAFLRDFVEDRLCKLAEHEYRGWVNGHTPFVTPRELQIWRLRQFVQYIWYWNLPDDEDLSMIFNLTKRRASGLASDFIARFRKTVIYPVAMRRLYSLINLNDPVQEGQSDPKGRAKGAVYTVASRRLVEAAQNLVDDIHTEKPGKIMAPPYVFDEELNRMWIDNETIDVMKTDERLRKRLYEMYKIPDS